MAQDNISEEQSPYLDDDSDFRDTVANALDYLTSPVGSLLSRDTWTTQAGRNRRDQRRADRQQTYKDAQGNPIPITRRQERQQQREDRAEERQDLGLTRGMQRRLGRIERRGERRKARQNRREERRERRRERRERRRERRENRGDMSLDNKQLQDLDVREADAYGGLKRKKYEEGKEVIKDETKNYVDISFEESIPKFVDKITKLSMEEVALPKRRDEFIQGEIRHKSWVAQREGFPEYNTKFFNNAIKERRREIAEEQDPLLSKRQIKQDGGEMNEQMSMLMEEEQPMLMEEEQPMLPDEEMEEDYVDYVIDITLEEQDKEYLENALLKDAKLSEIFDTVIESASEFSGSGSVEGPGSERSDSIPARLSDGEFVFTAKATEEIGADNLQLMMEDAEAEADERLQAYGGGSIEEPQVAKVVETSTSTRVLKPTSSTTPMLGQREEDVLQDALTTNMLNRTTKHVQS